MSVQEPAALRRSFESICGRILNVPRSDTDTDDVNKYFLGCRGKEDKKANKRNRWGREEVVFAVLIRKGGSLCEARRTYVPVLRT